MKESSNNTRIATLLSQLRAGIYDKDRETALALLAAMAGESILLLGPPGVAKSMVARRLKAAFSDAQSFEYLMSRFSTPDEIFGPVSIQSLKQSDRYERATDGFLPTADVVFLDEIWKAGPAIQNTLLTVMNEKVFRNGTKEMHIPLKLLVAASNELPTKDEGLEALWDRFLIRMICRPISDEQTFRQMITAPESEAPSPTLSGSISNEEYELWQRQTTEIGVPTEVLEAITFIRHDLQEVASEGTELKHAVYVSDRRWKHIVRLLRTSALLQGRDCVETADLMPAYHCLWNDPGELPAVREIVLQALFAPVNNALSQLEKSVNADLQACEAQAAISRSMRESDHRDDALVVVDRFFYSIEGHGTGHTCIFVTDFKQLPDESAHEKPARGVLYTDPIDRKRRIARLITPMWDGTAPVPDKEAVTLARDAQHIYINGVRFRMKRSALGNDELLRFGTTPNEGPMPMSSTCYEDEATIICERAEQQVVRMEQNLFGFEEDVKRVRELLRDVFSRVASVRVGIRKLLYDEER